MTHYANRHHNYRGERTVHHDRNVQRDRSVGVRTLDRVGVDRPAARRPDWHLTPDQELLSTGVHDVVKERIQSVLRRNTQDGGHALDRDEDTVYFAYAAQKERLSDPEVVDGLTMPQYTQELMAQVVLYAPSMASALERQHEHKNKLVFAEFDDIIKQLVAVARPRELPNIIAVLKERSNHINTRFGHSGSLLSKKGYIEALVKGERAEIAILDAVNSDPQLEGIVPEGEDADTRGIDFVAGKKGSGELINIDIKSFGSYVIHFKELHGYSKEDHVDFKGTDGIFCFTGVDEYNRRHYLLNADAEVFGEMQTDGNKYSPDGQKRVVQAIYSMLEQ
jgi:hypothetical protein